jgi:hypothetical protein
VTLAPTTDNLCAVHPEIPATGACSNCGTFGCSECLSYIGSNSVCSRCLEDGRVTAHALPWESRAELGLFRAWWMTFAALASRPAQLFEAMDPKRPLGEAWRFAALSIGMVLGLFTALAVIVCGLGLVSVTLGDGLEAALVEPAAGTIIALLAVVYLFAMSIGPFCTLGCLMALHHPLLRVVGGGQHGFRATLQVGLYSLAFYPLAVIPCIGMFVIMGILGYQAIGYSKIHDEPVWKSSLAVFLPMCFFGLLYILLFAFTSGFLNDFSL